MWSPNAEGNIISLLNDKCTWGKGQPGMQAGPRSHAFPHCSAFFQEKRRVRLYRQAEPRETVFLSTASTLQIHWPNSAQHTTLRNLGYRAEQKTQGLRPRFGFDTVPGAACSLQPVPEGSIEGALWPPTMGYRCAHPIRKHQLLSSED